jgi:rhamnosyltransferase
MSAMAPAVIVSVYEPPPSLYDLLTVLLASDVPVIVVDDGSTTPISVPDGVDLVCMPTNQGLAAALNAGLLAARSRGATHVLTLDQDSRIASDYLSAVQHLWAQALSMRLRPAVMGPDDITGVVYRGELVGEFTHVPEVMQSGALFDLSALAVVGDFDPGLVIDTVDTDVCLRLKDAGWDVLVAPLTVSHQIGRSRAYRFAGRTVLLTRHQPFRDYYMARNRILVMRRHGWQHKAWAVSMARRTFTAILLTLLLDSDRSPKLRAILRGLWDGLRNRSGPLPLHLRNQWTTATVQQPA